MRYFVFIIVAAALAAAPARAEDRLLAAAPLGQLPAVQGDGSPVSRPAVDLEAPDDPEPFPDLRLRLPRPRWQPGPGTDLVDQVTLTRLPPGSLAVRYEGPQGFVVRRVRKELRTHWSRSLRERWEGAVLDDDEYEDALDGMDEALGDLSTCGRWWERAWWDSLPAGKGGAPAAPHVHVVGQRVDVVRLGPWALSNDLRARFDGLTIVGLDAARQVVRRPARTFDLARSHARLERVARAGDDADEEDLEPPPLGPDDEVDDSLLPEPGVQLTLLPPEPGRSKAGGSAWRFRLRPSVRLTLSSPETAFVRDVSLRVTLTVATRKGREPWLGVEAVLRYRPDQHELQAGVEVALLTW